MSNFKSRKVDIKIQKSKYHKYKMVKRNVSIQLKTILKFENCF